MTEAHPLGPNPEQDAIEFDPVSPIYQVLEVTIGRKLAENILETRAPNRPIRDSVVQKYANDMKKQHWLRNGQTIKFDRFGRLLDGQHRLWAVIMNDHAQDFTVVLGLEPEAMATVDTGIPRSFADVIAINGTQNARQVSSVMRIIWSYESGDWQTNKTPSHLDLAGIMSRFPTVTDFVAEHKSKMRVIGMHSPLLFTAYMAHRLDSTEALRFLDSLSSGADLQTGNPVFALRERLLAMRAERAHQAAKPHYVAALTIKAWNAFYADREIMKLQWQQSREPRPTFDPPIPGLRQPAPERILKDKA